MYMYVLCMYIYNLHIQTKDEFAYAHCIRVLYHPIGTSRPRCWEFVSTDCVHMYIWGFWPTFWRKNLQDGTCLRTFVHSSHVLGCGKRKLWEALTSLGKFYNKDHSVLFWHRASSVQDHWLNVTRGGVVFFPNGKLRGMIYTFNQSTYPMLSDAGGSKWRFIWKIPYYLNVTILVVTGILGCVWLCRAPSSRVAKWHQRHLEASRIIRPMARALEFLGHEKFRCQKSETLTVPQAKLPATRVELDNFIISVAILVDVFVISVLI